MAKQGKLLLVQRILCSSSIVKFLIVLPVMT